MSGSGLLHPAIAAVAAAAVRRLGAEPPPHDSAGPVDVVIQRRMLQSILEQGGPSEVLLAGRRFDRYDDHPLFVVLNNSDRVDVVIDKIARLNRYFHSHHRHRVVSASDRTVDLEHVSLRGPAPHPLESLFVAGLYLATLERVGCGGLRLRFPDGPETRWAYERGRQTTVPIEGTGRWLFEWDRFDARRPLPGVDELLLTDPGTDLEEASTETLVAILVSRDLSRVWRVADVASDLRMSSRTLQRRLTSEGTSLTRILSERRIAEARRLLRDPERTVTDIGYVLGFADTAHFTRTFAAAMGSPPSVWRKGAIPTG